MANSGATFSLRNRNPDVLKCIANLSNDEVFTPPEFAGSRPKAGVNGAGHRFCFETYQVIEERTYARACTSITDRSCSRKDR